MKLRDYEIEYLDQTIEELESENLYSAFDLNRRIYLLIDMNEEDDDFDEDNVEYIR